MTEFPEEFLTKLATARRVVALTGAGTSAEVGIPTFQEAQTGLWARYSPEDLATPQAFLRNPRLVWEWYQWRRELVRDTRPGMAHLALAMLEERIPSVVVATQNVDGLHQRAGSRQVLELHGNILRTRCHREGFVIPMEEVEDGAPPVCPQCGGPLRPDIVWFGESIPTAVMVRASRAVEEAEIFLSIGTSSLVWPAAGLVPNARRAGAYVVEINPEPTPLSGHAHCTLRGKAGVVLKDLLDSLWI